MHSLKAYGCKHKCWASNTTLTNKSLSMNRNLKVGVQIIMSIIHFINVLCRANSYYIAAA